MNAIQDPAQLLNFSVQRALLGNVTAKLAAVVARINHEEIIFEAYFFPGFDSFDREQTEEISSEVIADFPEGYQIQTLCRPTDDLRGHDKSGLMYLRKEALQCF